jgi:hypothetical protein
MTVLNDGKFSREIFTKWDGFYEVLCMNSVWFEFYIFYDLL